MPPVEQPIPNYPFSPALNRRRIIFLGCLVIAFLLWELLYAGILSRSTATASDLSDSNILSAINKERQLRNLLTLKTSDFLSLAAQSKADDMIARKYFSHTDPEGNYIWPKIVAAGYSPYTQLGENLAIEFYNTESLVSAWMNSPTHRANILNEGFQDQGMGLGFGTVSKAEYYSAVVNTFGALSIKKSAAETSPPKSEPAPAPRPAEQASTPPTAITETVETPKETEETQPAKNWQPIALRGEPEPRLDFAVASAEEEAGNGQPVPEQTGPAANGRQAPVSKFDIRTINRYIVLAFGGVFMLFLLADLRSAVGQKIQRVDKKINNLFVLILALIIIGFLYVL